MGISNRKIIISICILILFVFLSCIKTYHKDLEISPNNDSLYITKIQEKEGFIKILAQKRFLFKDSLLQKVELVVSTRI